MGSPVATIASRARSRSSATVRSCTATPTIGHVSSPRRSSRESERNVITLARSPVMPKTTNTSACWAPVVLAAARGRTAVAIEGSLSKRLPAFEGCFRGRRGGESPHPGYFLDRRRAVRPHHEEVGYAGHGEDG